MKLLAEYCQNLKKNGVEKLSDMVLMREDDLNDVLKQIEMRKNRRYWDTTNGEQKREGKHHLYHHQLHYHIYLS